MRTLATWLLLLALVLPASAWAQDANPPPNAPPVPGALPAPAEPPPPPVAEPPPPPPPEPRLVPVHKKRNWVLPAVIALEAGALGFAIASITIINIGGPADTWRVPVAGGLGGGTIACAGAGLIIELVAR